MVWNFDSSLNRRARRARASQIFHAVLQSLEPRVLLSTVFVHDTGNITTNGTNLQAAINAAALGDTIVLDANVVYLAPGSGFNLPNKVSGSGTITIESSTIFNNTGLPAGVRVDPSQSALMPKLETPGFNAPIIKTSVAAHDYAFIGLEMLPKNATDTFTAALIQLGDSGSNQDTVAEVPHDFNFDRCYIHGLDGTGTQDYKRGIGMDSANTTVQNSYISNIHNTGQDSQAIGGFNGTGNYTINNNFLEATGENFILGGADTTIPNNVPTGLVFTNNYCYKRLSWDPYDPSYAGVHMSVTNLFELKNCLNAVVDHNIFENNWVGADQPGFAILFTPRNQDGGNTWAQVSNVTFTNNVIHHSAGGISILTSDYSHPSLPSHDLIIRNNIMYDLGDSQGGYGNGIAIGRGPQSAINITIDHNLILSERSILVLDSGQTVFQSVASNVTITNNIGTRGLYGIFGTSRGEGNTSINTYLPNSTITNNIFVGAASGSYPAGNFFPGTLDAVKFFDLAAYNYNLLTGSPGKGTGTLGSDIGPNIATLAPEWLKGNIDYNNNALSNYWNLNEGSGTTANDIGLGTHHNGTLSGTTLPTWSTAGAQSNALSFDGVTSYVNIATFPVAAGNQSVVAFIKPNDHTGTASTIVSKGNGSFLFQINSAGNLTATVAGVTVTDASFNYFSVANKNKWYQVAFVFDDVNNTLTLYRNGAQVATGADAGAFTDSAQALWIGRDVQANAGSFLGLIDDVRYYSGLSGATTALQLFNLYHELGADIDILPEGTVTGTTANVGAFAMDHAGSANITYHWAVFSGPSTVAFSPNDIVANNTTGFTATFNKAGTYIFSLTLTSADGVANTYYSGKFFVLQKPTPTSSISISPSSATVQPGAGQQFTPNFNAVDQFGQPITTALPWTWAVNAGGAGGTIDANTGLYVGPATGPGTDTVTLSLYGTQYASATVNVTAVGSAPTAPSSLVATPNGYGITLTWNDNSNTETGFHVYRSTDNVNFTNVLNAPVNNTASGSFTDTTVSPGVLYYYYISAFNSVGESSFTNTASAKTIPAAPTVLNATAGAGSIALTWTDNSTNEVGFHLQRGTDGINFTTVQTLNPNTNSFNDSGVSVGATYYYRVTSFNSTGDSTPSNTASATPTTMPVPTGLTAYASADTQLTATWTDSITGESGYNLQYSLDGSNWIDAGTSAANATLLTITGLTPNTLYQVRIRSFAGVTTSDWSTPVLARTWATINGLIAYEGFNYTPGDSSAWQGQTGGLGFTNAWSLDNTAGIYNGILNGSLPYTKNTIPLSETGNSAFLWEESTSGTRNLNYTLGQDGTSLWVGFMVRSHADGPTPLLQPAIQLGSDASNSLHLGCWNDHYGAWAYINGGDTYMQINNSTIPVDNVPDFLVYRIDFSATTAGDKVLLWVNPTPGTQPTDVSANSTWTLATNKHFLFTDNNLRISRQNYYNRTTFDELRLGSNYASVAPVAVPTSPTTLNATPGSASVGLTWNDTSSGELGFHVERSTDNINFTLVQTVGANANSFNDSPLGNGTYYYRVTAYNATGDSLYSNTASAVVVPSDTTPPTITAVYASSTTWSAAFLNNLANTNQGSATLGYKVSVGANQLQSLPWATLNQLSITFSEDVSVQQAALSLTGLNVPSYAIQSFNYNSGTHTATWTLTSSINNDTLTLSIPAANVTDTANNQLDGEWTDSVSTASGNGTTGGNFSFHLNVLPADINHDNIVDGADFDTWFTHLLNNTYAPTNGDLNADGLVDGADYDLWFTHLGFSLPSQSFSSTNSGLSSATLPNSQIPLAPTSLTNATLTTDSDDSLIKSKIETRKSKIKPTLIQKRLFH